MPRVVVLRKLRLQILKEYHGGCLAGHFSGNRLYKTLARHWWWQHMHRDAMDHAKNCPQCAVVEGTGRKVNLHYSLLQLSALFR